MTDDRQPPWAPAADGFDHIDDHLVHQGYIWNLVTADFTDPDGAAFRRDIVRSPGSVGIVPVSQTAKGPSVVLVAQYRPPFERAILEIPAGMRDVPGEEPEATARRELVEEVGLHTNRLTKLIDMIPSPGMTDAVCQVFLAQDCVAVDDDRQGPEEQRMIVVDVMLADAVDMVERGDIQDAKTVIGVLMAARQLGL